MIEKRCFLQWFLMTLACGVGGFFAWHTGLLRQVWDADMTHMTSVIAAMFVLAVGYMGFASWRYDRSSWKGRDAVAYADVGLAHWAAAGVIYVGLIGTVIGLMWQLQALGHVDPANPASGATFLSVTVRSLSTAFYATGAGLVAALLIGAITQNLAYFLDRNEVVE